MCPLLKKVLHTMPVKCSIHNFWQAGKSYVLQRTDNSQPGKENCHASNTLIIVNRHVKSKVQ